MNSHNKKGNTYKVEVLAAASAQSRSDKISSEAPDSRHIRRTEALYVRRQLKLPWHHSKHLCNEIRTVLTLQRDQDPSIGYSKSDDRGEFLSDG